MVSYSYDAFGRLMNKSGSLEQPFRFSTKRYDEGTGLSYYGYRFYAPAIERWLNRDPIGEAGGINLYGFVQNDPVNAVDPWGLWVKNNYDKPILIKPEHGNPEWLASGECYDDNIDGVKPPSWDGDWYKVKGNDDIQTNVTIDKWGFPTPSGDYGGLGGTNFPDLGLKTDWLPGRKRPSFEDRRDDWRLKR